MVIKKAPVRRLYFSGAFIFILPVAQQVLFLAAALFQ